MIVHHFQVPLQCHYLYSLLHNLWETTLTSPLENKKTCIRLTDMCQISVILTRISTMETIRASFPSPAYCDWATKDVLPTSIPRLLKVSLFSFHSILVCLERGMRKFKAWVISNRRMSVWSLISSVDQSLGDFVWKVEWPYIRFFGVAKNANDDNIKLQKS